MNSTREASPSIMVPPTPIKREITDFTCFQDYFNYTLKCDRQRNLNSLLEEVKSGKISKETNKKFTNWANSWGYPLETVKEKIATDEMFAAQFAKDPLKQNLAENLQMEWLQKVQNKKISKLPSGGKNAMYLEKGELVSDLKKKPEMATKSLDFDEELDDHHNYIYAKYTGEEGGAQDNQCNDGMTFVSGANDYCNTHANNTQFTLLIDGAYYTESKKTKIMSLIEDDNKERVRIFTSDTFQ